MPGLKTLSSYHWALVVGPKKASKESQGYRFHAKEKYNTAAIGNTNAPQSVWEYEEVQTKMMPTHMLLARIVVGKVQDMSRLRSILQQTPLRPEVAGWNCVWWVMEALMAATQDKKALGTCIDTWESARDTAMGYVEKKKAAHRFDGTVPVNLEQVPIWDMLDSVELLD